MYIEEIISYNKKESIQAIECLPQIIFVVTLVNHDECHFLITIYYLNDIINLRK